MTVAKPYMEKRKDPQKPSRDAAPHTDHKDVNKRSTSDVQIKDVIKGESLGFQNHGSAGHDTDNSDDDDNGGGDGNQMIKENKRDTEKENKSNQNLHRSFQNTPLPAADSSIVSVSKWPTQSRRELPTSKSIEQESWHNQSYEGDPRLETPHTDEGRSEKDSAAKDMKNHQNEARGWSNRTSQSKTMETIPKSGTPLPSSHLDPVSSEDVRHRTTEQQMTTKPLSQQNNQNSSSLIERSKIDDEESDSSSVAEHRRRFARESSSDSPTSNDSKRRKSPDPGISDEKKTRIEKENESKLSTSQLLLLEKDQKKTNLRTGKGTGDSSDFPPNSMLPVASSWETAVSEGLQQEQSREMKNEERNPMKLYHSEKMFERKKNNMGYVRSKGKREDRPASMPLPQNQSQDLQKKSENDNIKRPSSLSQSVDETYVKRSISWSAAVSGNGKPPRPKSISSVPSSIFMPTSSSSSSAAVKSKSQRNVKTKENSLTSSFKDIPVTSLDFDGHVALPPLSEYALKTGVIMEGWVEKKSSVTGFWQKVQISERLYVNVDSPF